MPIWFTQGGEWRRESFATSKGPTQKQTVSKTIYSLRSWRYCKRTRNNVLAADEEDGEGIRIFLAASPLGIWRLRRQNFISRVPTVPPATQAKPFVDDIT